MDKKGNGPDMGASGVILSLVPKDKLGKGPLIEDKVCTVYNTGGNIITEIFCNQVVGITDDIYGLYQVDGDFSLLRGFVNMANIGAIELQNAYNVTGDEDGKDIGVD